MPKPGSMAEFALYQQGEPVDRVGMMARRAQMARPQGLSGFADRQRPQPAQPPPQSQQQQTQSQAQPRQQQPRGQPKQDRWAEVASRLWQKGIPAKVQVAPGQFSYATPGEGIIGYGDIPTSVTSKIPTDEPILGWDPNKLEPDEKFLLNYLVGMRLKEQAASEQDFANDPRVREQAGLPPQGGSVR